jgi:hypothetical protein
MFAICGSCDTKAEFNGSDALLQPPTGTAAKEQAKGIEAIVRRARQIHREHGGLFGYDLDDWVEAWQRPE